MSPDADERQPHCLKNLFEKFFVSKQANKQAFHGVSRRLLILLAKGVVLAMGKVGAREHIFYLGNRFILYFRLGFRRIGVLMEADDAPFSQLGTIENRIVRFGHSSTNAALVHLLEL